MKTLHLSIIIIFTIYSTVGIGIAYAQYGSGFYPPEHYPPTNDTNLKLVVMNSTEFKIRTTGYNYTLAGIDYNWISKGNNYYDFGGARVTFLVWGFGNTTTKGVAFYLDSQSKIKNVFEYDADHPPAGFYTGTRQCCLLAEFNNTKPAVAQKSESPLKQFKLGIALKEIKCEYDLQLIIRAEDRSPACVKPEDVSKLVERGWAVKPQSLQEQLDFANACIGPNEACKNRSDSREVTTDVVTNSNITHMELKAYGFVCCGLDGDLLKGNLNSNTGPISDANVAISINGIMMDYAKTYPDGCFQFNQWNYSKLSEQTNEFLTNEKNSGVFGPFNLAFSADYAGDGNNHNPASANATSSTYLTAIPLPPPQFEATVTPSQVNVTQGSSSNLQISVKPMVEQWDVIQMSLYLEGLPCGISYHVSQASDNNTSSTTHAAVFDISLNTTTYSPEGMYFVHMVQNGTNSLVDHDIGTFSLNVLKMR